MNTTVDPLLQADLVQVRWMNRASVTLLLVLLSLLLVGAGRIVFNLPAWKLHNIDIKGEFKHLPLHSLQQDALGDIQGNEGVYGLQRAFKIAGAKYLIMSLWQVDDEATMKFMEVFYRKWLEGKMPIPEAFRAAQADMRERAFGQPYLWAGFVLVE